MDACPSAASASATWRPSGNTKKTSTCRPPILFCRIHGPGHLCRTALDSGSSGSLLLGWLDK
eukprot:scaffold194_cov357-Pavlova_lutheri.AAC.2